MNQYNYDQFNYDNYQAPRASVLSSAMRKLRNPVVMTVAILLSGAAFAGVMMATSGPKNEADIPVIQADAGSYKQAPENEGGAEIPFQDSTVYASLRDNAGAVERDVAAAEAGETENLLAGEEPVDRLEAFAAEAERIIEGDEKPRSSAASHDLIAEATGVAPIADAQGGDTLDAVKLKQQATSNEAEQVADVESLLQKIDQSAEAAQVTHKPGASPETVKFVRDVLDDKNAAKTVASNTDGAEAAADIQPAAGLNMQPGTHYVQLGSVKSEAGAAQEWSKLQKKYASQLQSSDYRVQRADLGERGVFYRIQAGPMSGESATEVCDSIKAQSPGACLVTK